jgi:hypothetical protein
MNYENLIIGTLSNEAFVMVNKKLAKRLGFIEAGLLGEFIATHKMCKANDSFYKDNWFFITQPYIEKNLGIKRSVFESAVKNLKKENVIEQKKMGLPAKNYYMIKWDIIALYMSENEPQSPSNPGCGNPASLGAEILQPCVQESSKFDCGNPATIRTISKNNNLKTNNKNNKTLLTKNDLINICNSFYSTYSVGRWSKKQWTTLIEKYVTETDWNEVAFPNSFIEGSIKGMARHFDYREGKILYPFDKDGIDYLDSEGKVPFYNWLEE